MNEDVEALLYRQLSLFEGGYDTITIEVLAHLANDSDGIQFGFTLRETGTSEPIGITVWTEPIDRTEHREIAEVMAQVVGKAQRALRPF